MSTVKTHVYIPLSLCIQLTDRPDGHKGYQYFAQLSPMSFASRLEAVPGGLPESAQVYCPLVVLSHLFAGSALGFGIWKYVIPLSFASGQRPDSSLGESVVIINLFPPYNVCIPGYRCLYPYF